MAQASRLAPFYELLLDLKIAGTKVLWEKKLIPEQLQDPAPAAPAEKISKKDQNGLALCNDLWLK
jgi:hypothetical protein